MSLNACWLPLCSGKVFQGTILQSPFHFCRGALPLYQKRYYVFLFLFTIRTSKDTSFG